MLSLPAVARPPDLERLVPRQTHFQSKQPDHSDLTRLQKSAVSACGAKWCLSLRHRTSEAISRQKSLFFETKACCMLCDLYLNSQIQYFQAALPTTITHCQSYLARLQALENLYWWQNHTVVLLDFCDDWLCFEDRSVKHPPHAWYPILFAQWTLCAAVNNKPASQHYWLNFLKRWRWRIHSAFLRLLFSHSSAHAKMSGAVAW